MKPEHQNLTPTELALLTWHGGNDLEHIIIKLAGEIGELLDLYGKHKYKPGFNWFRCKCGHEHTFDHCTWEDIDIDNRAIYTCPCQTLTPLVLDEMGDIWFYLRVMAWVNDKEAFTYFQAMAAEDIQNCLYSMYLAAGEIFYKTEDISFELDSIYSNLCRILSILGYGIEDLTRLNYIKLNSEESHHGWKVKN